MALAILGFACADEQSVPVAPEERLFELRLSSTRSWSACLPDPGSQRCSQPQPSATLERFAPSALRGQASGETVVDAATAHHYGLWNLAIGGPAAIDRAVDLLRLVSEQTGSPASANDAAVALALRSTREGDSLDLVRALGMIERAALAAPADAAIAFNRALLRERFHLAGQAEKAWTDYLRLEKDVEWAAEATRRLAALRRIRGAAEDRSRDPQVLRGELEEVLLPEWARRALVDPEPAHDALGRLRRQAEEVLALSSDPLLVHTVEAIEQAYAERDRPRLELLARAHAGYGAVVEIMTDREFATAETRLQGLREQFRAGGSPFRWWAEFLLLRCHYQQMDWSRFDEQAALLVEELPASAALAVRARTFSVIGTARFARGSYGEARAAYRESSRLFELLGERTNQEAVDALCARLDAYLGRQAEIFDVWHRALAGALTVGDDTRRRLISLGAATVCMELGEPEAALVFQREAVALATESSEPIAISSTLTRYIALSLDAGLPVDREDLARAEEWVARIPDEEARWLAFAQLRQEQGRAARQESPRAALDLFEESAEHFERSGASLYRPQILLEMARALRALECPEEAEARLRAALDEIESQRRSTADAVQRIGLGDRAEAVTSELVDLRLAAGRPEAAFWAVGAERGRSYPAQGPAARSYLPQPDGTAGQLWRRDGALLVYEMLPERLVIWVVRLGSLESEKVEIGERRLANLVAGLREVVASQPDLAKRYLAELYRLLILPVSHHLGTDDHLYVVLDDELFLLPFSALFNAERDVFLVEDHPVTILPHVELVPWGEGEPPTEPVASLLAVADPAFDAGEHPELSRLPSAREEVSLAASYYPQALILEDGVATVGRVAAEVGRFDVLHVAAHALARPNRPFLSSLVLSPGGDDEGELDAVELSALDPGRLRVVVLASCSSAGETVSSSEGPLGLVWPFLVNGVRAVVATHWLIEDQEAVELFPRFHRHLTAGLPPAHALRQAQLELLDRTPISAWAAASSYGS